MVRALEAGSPPITVSSVSKPWGPRPRAQKGQKVRGSGMRRVWRVESQTCSRGCCLSGDKGSGIFLLAFL